MKEEICRYERGMDITEGGRTGVEQVTGEQWMPETHGCIPSVDKIFRIVRCTLLGSTHF